MSKARSVRIEEYVLGGRELLCQDSVYGKSDSHTVVSYVSYLDVNDVKSFSLFFRTSYVWLY